MRLWIPESPRWLITHGRAAEADKIVDGIEERFRAAGPYAEKSGDGPCQAKNAFAYAAMRSRRHPSEGSPAAGFVGLSLMAAQAYFYNAIFFTYALILTTFYAIPSDKLGWYILPFALANFLGPLFDRAPVRYRGAAARC